MLLFLGRVLTLKAACGCERVGGVMMEVAGTDGGPWNFPSLVRGYLLFAGYMTTSSLHRTEASPLVPSVVAGAGQWV